VIRISVSSDAPRSQNPERNLRPIEFPRDNMATTVSIDKAAELLGVSRRTVYNRIKDGELQTIRTYGGSQRVIVESLAQATSARFGRRRPLIDEVVKSN
jgi:excisionase family DNA binding protein